MKHQIYINIQDSKYTTNKQQKETLNRLSRWGPNSSQRGKSEQTANSEVRICEYQPT